MDKKITDAFFCNEFLTTTYMMPETIKLSDLDTSKLHYVAFPEAYKNLVVIDFDLKNEKGEKDYILNLKAASKWPKTYAELSKSGAGIHLHFCGRHVIPKQIYEEYERLVSEYNKNKVQEIINGDAFMASAEEIQKYTMEALKNSIMTKGRNEVKNDEEDR